MTDIIIRPATENDAPIIARCVLAAMEIVDIDTIVPSEMHTAVKNLEVATLDDARLYSCKNSLIADVNGDAVGCLISY